MRLFIETVILYFMLWKVGSTAAQLKEFKILDLQHSIQASRHHPVCVIFKNDDQHINIEKVLPQAVPKNLTYWEFGQFSVQKFDSIPVLLLPTFPSLQCYIGQKKPMLYRGKAKRTAIHKWLTQVAEDFDESLDEATIELIANTTSTKGVTILGFLSVSYQKHSEEEEILSVIQEQFKHHAVYGSVKVLVVHRNRGQATALIHHYQIKLFPTVLLIENSKFTKNKPFVIKTFESTDVNSQALTMFLLPRDVPATWLTQENFESLALEQYKNTVPMLVLLYTVASKYSLEYLYAFHRTIQELMDLQVNLRYGLLELSSETRDLGQEHIPALQTTPLPFSVVFMTTKKKTTVVGIDQLIITDRPTPLTVAQALVQYRVTLTTTSEGQLDLEESYIRKFLVNHTEISVLAEGPYGSICTIHSSNLTNSNPVTNTAQPKRFPNTTKTIKIQKDLFRSWHDRHDTDEIDRRLSRVGKLPLVTDLTWSDVIDKSHAPLHPFYQNEQWRGEITKVALVVFIIADCGSCRRNLPLFEALYERVKDVDGGSLYLANCTSDRSLCERNQILGFPTLVAFRGLGWSDGSDCVDTTQGMAVRVDYHGVLQEVSILKWFGQTAESAVENFGFNSEPLSASTKDVSAYLVATVQPITSQYLPRVSTKGRPEFYPYRCLRLACERLYGQVGCGVTYSTLIPSTEYNHVASREMVITKVVLVRRDGLNATIMLLSKSLQQTLEKEEETAIHTFHKAHKYSLGYQQRCESDFAQCTDYIVQFTLDHARLPITHISAHMFHTKNNLIFQGQLPVLVVLGHADNLTTNSSFYSMLEAVAYEFFNDVITVAVDVDQYSSWANSFVPRQYSRVVHELSSDQLPPLYVYPRLCVIYWTNHNKAAFYPSLQVLNSSELPYQYKHQDIVRFLGSFLKSPAEYLEDSEHF